MTSYFAMIAIPFRNSISTVATKQQRQEKKPRAPVQQLEQRPRLRGLHDGRDGHCAHDLALEDEIVAVSPQLLHFHQLALVSAKNDHCEECPRVSMPRDTSI